MFRWQILSLPLLFLLTFSLPAQAQKNCNEMEIWDYNMGMCMPVPMEGMPMKMLMLHGNSFFMETVEEKPRGRDAFSVPNNIMIDSGSSLGDHHYLNFEFMGTVEKWTFPSNGTPELLQIGESQADGAPFLDAQHPHSSPIMGLTLSDTISWDGKDFVKIWIAPRGESTDGPIAFMHRPTGEVNPDAPLGHHIGQDVGHISSSVVGAWLKQDSTNLEFSTFNGTEPNPTQVDLPIATPNSYAFRLSQEFSPQTMMMLSAAYVKNPELDQPNLDHVWRYSSSLYHDLILSPEWKFNNALIWGLINGYDNAGALNSFAEEFLFKKNIHEFWGRLEVLQRTPNELQISGFSDADVGRWVTAMTLGYTQEITRWNEVIWGVGGSITKDFLPADFQNAYTGNPVSGKIFVRAHGMKMWDL